MIKELICVLVLMLAGAAAQAHPGVGIVKDSRVSQSAGSGLCSKRGMTARL